MRYFLAILFCLFSAMAFAAVPPIPKTGESLKDIPLEKNFTVSIRGDGKSAFLSQKKCVYFEWVYGIKKGVDWQMFSLGFHSQDDVWIETPYGDFLLRYGEMRLHLKPSYTKTYTSAQVSEAPEAVREMIQSEKKPIVVEEYCLEPLKTYHYHAQTEEESYYLPPPAPGAQPTRHVNTVLAVSDEPFVDGKTATPLTPSYAGRTY
jgi:hypothetical protein